MINYIKYVAGSNKGNTVQGDVFNDPFRLGKVDSQYTSSRVTKDYNVVADGTTPGDLFGTDDGTVQMNWKPVIKGTISLVSTANGGTVTTYVDNGKGELIAVPAGGSVSRRTVMVQPVDDAANMGDLRLEGVDSYVETIVYNSTGAQVTASVGTIDYETGVITITGIDTFPAGTVQVAYSYKFVVA